MTTTSSFDGTSIDWSEIGDGPAVVLVHGITESSESWAPVRDRLAETHRVISLDLRGHGASGDAERYDLEAMAGDVINVIAAANADRPHLVGHSLGGVVVSAAGAATSVSSIVNVDQSLRLASFKEGLEPIRAMLNDLQAFPVVIEQMFEGMRGPLNDEETNRIGALRRPNQAVVLGVWDLPLNSTVEEIDAVVEDALAGYADSDVPYLSLFGISPGDDYGDWLGRFISNSTVEEWADHGHYPHLVDPDRFVDRLRSFWSVES